jgi:alkylation response protein AidB-like acyl-CoA dehydrogenase
MTNSDTTGTRPETTPRPDLVDLPVVDLGPEVEALRAEVRAFLSDELARASFAPRCDAWLRGHDPAFSRRLGERGWIGMTWPRRYGGHERSALERFVVTEELLAAGAPVAAHWGADRQLGPMLLRFGTEAQRERFLPAFARGECPMAAAMSEPDSGSDLASLRCTATRTDGGWSLAGRKVWTSHAHRSEYVVVLCRTDASGDRHGGISQLIVDLATPGVEVRPIPVLTGEHHFCELVFDDVSVPDAMVLGNIGDGWRQIGSELTLERGGPDRFLSTFPLLMALVAAVGPAPTATQIEAIGRLVAACWTLRRLSLGVAASIAGGDDASVLAALVKDQGTQFEQGMVELVRRVRPQPPGSATELERLLGEAVLAAPGFTLRGGTTEILRGIVARGFGVR